MGPGSRNLDLLLTLFAYRPIGGQEPSCPFSSASRCPVQCTAHSAIGLGHIQLTRKREDHEDKLSIGIL